jgi:copper transport protein
MISIRPVSKIGGTLLCLGLGVVLLVACGGARSAPTQATGTPPSFQTMLKTSDGMFEIRFNVTPDHMGLNTFTVNVNDVTTGKPATTLHVQLSTTMLDMAMGTDLLDLPSGGNGHYSAQGALSMAGAWEIHILLRTPDATLHEAQVRLSTKGEIEEDRERAVVGRPGCACETTRSTH